MKPLALAITLVLVAITVPSCLFDTRDAQPPVVGANACTLEQPGRPFICMAGAVSDQRDANYERSISDNFIFSPTFQDSLDQAFISKPDLFTLWDKPTELQALGILFSDNDKSFVDFGTPQALINKSTFVRFKTSYSLTVVTATPDTTVYKGVAQIDVKNEGGNWRVTFWDEVETVPGFRTWGYYRGILGLRFR